MKEKKQIPTLNHIPSDKRLYDAWVTRLGNCLHWQKLMSQSAAMAQAHLTLELLKALGEGIVVFTYIKKDGRARRARGTLCPGVSEAYDAYVRARSSEEREKDGKARRKNDEDTTFCYWDLDQHGFRSFDAERLWEINEVTIVSRKVSKTTDFTD